MFEVMSPSSVLFVLHVETHSGPQRCLAPRLAALRERGARITTLVPAPGAAAEDAAKLGRVLVGAPGAMILPRDPAAGLRLPYALLGQARAVARAVRATGADLVIVSSALMPGAFLGARRAGAGVLLYSGEVLEEAGARGAIAAALTRFAGAKADVVLACSNAVAEPYRRRGTAARVVHPPIEANGGNGLEDRAAELRRRLGVGPDERLVCSLGAITEGRGQDTLIEAFATSAQRGNGWRLVIAGEPYSRPLDREFASRLRALVAGLGLEERVVLAGRMDDPEALYSAADVFVNPARAGEAFGRASCEALLAGCPVVSSRVGGVTEALRDGETALLVEPDSPEGLAAAIERLLRDPKLAERLTRAGAADVARRFAPPVGKAAFTEAVQEALAARSTRRTRC
jgi:glycosyltransferase involved in cell wall biosynthesis